MSVAKRPEAFVCGVGTGGTVMGVGSYLRSYDAAIRVHPVQPAESPTLSTGCKAGSHRIQGISDEFIPAIVQLKGLNEVISIHDGDSILMAQKLASTLGPAVGISSGCNFLAAVRAQKMVARDAVVVTVFCDDSTKYLSTGLMYEKPVKPEYKTPEIERLRVETVGRAREFFH
jgi:cysteine synthase A